VNTNEIFQIVISVALVVVFIVQLGTLFAIYKLVKKLMGIADTVQTRTDPILEQTRQILVTAKPIIEKAQEASQQLAPILERTQELLATARDTTVMVRDTTASLKIEAEACMAAVSATTQEVSRLTTEQAQELSSLVNDTSNKLRRQVDTYHQVATRTALRIDDTAAIVQRDVLRPVGEISAILNAVRVFLEVLFAQEGKQPVHQVYQDEEMFI
jgi:methyl-accepting chemotaxis protein